MATRGGGRDLANIVETRLFFDKEFKNDYCTLWQCLSPSLQFTEPFPLLRFEKDDQLIRLNNEDIRGRNPEYVFQKLQNLKVNSRESQPRSNEVLKLTFIRGKDVIPEKHLESKVFSSINYLLSYASKCCVHCKCLHLL